MPPVITTLLGPYLSLNRPAGNVINPNTRQQMANAMAISARVHPNSAFNGLINTLHAYKSIPHVVELIKPNNNGTHLGWVDFTSSAIIKTLLSIMKNECKKPLKIIMVSS
jgi:hypothetical protein